ncbi:MAG: electron transfer flavoprotein subunit alpha/FixB family protein [Microthrixaceae bacterium]|nr:electron transfer flavoprotein subunit alpha/FixB family protein [Microthrixaceae bacterium]
MAEDGQSPAVIVAPTVVVAGTWTTDGSPDSATAAVLGFLGGLAAEVWGANLGPHRDQPGLADALGEVARSVGASAVVLPSGAGSESLAGLVAARERGTVSLDTRAIAATADGLTIRRPSYGGAFDVEILIPPTHLLVATLDTPAADHCDPVAPQGMLALEVRPGDTELIEQVEDSHELSITGAGRIVAGGRGVGGPEGFAELAILAEALDAALGASRPPCDAGWVPGRYQVGITGARVAPDLYVAVGISGSVQHRAGMQSSRTVVAVNNDPEAPMLDYADLAVVGDWREVVAGMIDELGAREAATKGADRCG